jgi:calcineurin-like phosphoesterase family protein
VSSVFYTADTHFNHPFVASTRGHDTAESHDEALIARFNARLHKKDHLWILGDAFMGSITAGLAQVARLNGTKHLILGNHDAAHPLHRAGHRKLRRFLEVFETVQLADQHRMADGTRVMLSHFPYKGDHYEDDRYSEWRLRDEGQYLLHGHVHDEWGMRGRMLNVGVDRNPYPVGIDTVAAIVRTGASL